MLIMFVVGVMNVLWVVIIAGFVLAEKLGPGGRSISYISGLLLIVWGAWMLAHLHCCESWQCAILESLIKALLLFL